VDGWSFLRGKQELGSVTGTVTRPHAGYQRYRSIPVRDKASFSILKRRNLLWRSPRLYLRIIEGTLSWIKRRVREVDHSLLFSTEVNIALCHTFTLPYQSISY
jgi:hypothetical protein